MELPIIIQLAALFITCAGIIFSYHKWRETVTHARIDKCKEDLEERIEGIENNYARREEFNVLAQNLKESLQSIKEEQHRMAQRFDEFFLRFIENSIKK